MPDPIDPTIMTDPHQDIREAVAALCAGEQDKYWQFHNELMSIAGDLSDGDILTVLATDPASYIDCRHFCDTTGHELLDAKEDEPSGVFQPTRPIPIG